MIMASSETVKYYNNKLIINELRITDYELKEKEITVIPYAVEIYGLDYKNILSKAGYQLKKEISFRELTYEQWAR